MRLIDGDVGSLWEGSQWWRFASSGRPTGPGTGRYYPYEVTNGAGPAREAYRGHADATQILMVSNTIRVGKGLSVMSHRWAATLESGKDTMGLEADGIRSVRN